MTGTTPEKKELEQQEGDGAAEEAKADEVAGEGEKAVE